LGLLRLTKKNLPSNKIEYSICWEDPQTIQKALHIKKDDVILSISSAGSNVLNFLLYDPKKILSVDYSPYQNYLLELQVEAIRNLDYHEFIELIGATSSGNREKIYNSVKSQLNRETRLFWDSNIDLVKKGITYNGRLEQGFKVLGKYMRFFIGEKKLEKLFKCKTIEEQASYFYRYIYGIPWRLGFGLGYNKYLFKIKLCYHLLLIYKSTNRIDIKKFFRYIQKSFYSTDILRKINHIFTDVPLRNNYFASLVLLNRYIDSDCFPPYLKEESFGILKDRVDRIEVITSNVFDVLRELPQNSIDKFNLSNMFDYWVNYKEFRQYLGEISRVGRNKGRFCYFSTRIDRKIPDDLEFIKPERQLSLQLLNEDRTFFYGDFQVGEILK